MSINLINLENKNERKYADLPTWIQSSQLCINQIDNINDELTDDSNIVCPIEFSNFDLKIQSQEDLKRLLKVIQFWGVQNSAIPYEIFIFIFNQPTCIDLIWKNSAEELKVLELFKTVDKTYTAIRNSYTVTKNVCRLITLLECGLGNVMKELFEEYVTDVGADIAVKIALTASNKGTFDVLKYLPHRDRWLNIHDKDIVR